MYHVKIVNSDNLKFYPIVSTIVHVRYSCVETVQYRACRYFLGHGKYAPTPAGSGDMGWLAPRHKQWLCVMRKWIRMLSMDNSFLTKKIFLHSMNQ